MADNQFKVKLVSAASPDRLTDRRESVIFDVSPDLIETRNVQYKTLDPLHAPGQMNVYQSTSSRTFNIANVRLISRTRQEASENLARLWTLRGWTVPQFGKGPQAHEDSWIDKLIQNNPNSTQARQARGVRGRSSTPRVNKSFLGAPPQVLLLSAYSRTADTVASRGVGHIRRVPVVIQQMSIPYPSDVDYIPTNDENPTPMPTVMTLDMTLIETHSPNEYENFSLDDYRLGNLKGF